MEDKKATKRGKKPSKSINIDNTETNNNTEEVKAKNPKAGKRIIGFRDNNSDKYIELDDDRIVPVVSVCSFPVGYKCKVSNNGRFLKWNEYGDEHKLTIGELKTMDGESKCFLHEPYFIVDDEEFMEVMGLTQLYNLVLSIRDLKQFYSQKPTTIRKTLNSLPLNTRKNLLQRTVSMLQTGELNDYNIVRMLKKDYGIEVEEI